MKNAFAIIAAPFVVLLSILCLMSCETTAGKKFSDFLATPAGKQITLSATSLIVSEAVTSRPDLIPVLEVLADAQEGIQPDLSQFDKPLLALGAQVVGSVTTTLGDGSHAQLIADSIRQGLALAEVALGNMESK